MPVSTPLHPRFAFGFWCIFRSSTKTQILGAIPVVGRTIILVLLVALAGSNSVSGRKVEPAQAPIESQCEKGQVRALASGDLSDLEIGGGECHSYQIDLGGLEFLHAVVQQHGIDVVLAIYDESGAKLSEVDRPNGSRGRETISIITRVPGPYFLVIRSLDSVTARGRYALTIDKARSPVAEDTTQVVAEQTVSEGERLRAKGSAESLRRAIEKFKSAAEKWRSLGDSYEEALSFYGAGISCTSVGENQAGIEFLNRALPVFVQLDDVHGQALVRAAMGWPYMYLGDTDKAHESFSKAFELNHSEGSIRGEGIALYGIGWVHALRGENQEALKDFSESLSRRRAAMDRRGEALTLTGIGKIQARLGNHAQAIEDLNLALTVLPTPHDQYAEADILSNLGWVHSATMEDALALEFFKRALPLRRQSGDSIGASTTLYGTSILHRRANHLQEAQSEIEEALEIIESLRARGSNQLLRISYFAAVQDYYEFYIALLMQLDMRHPLAGYAAKAFHACERAQARGLVDLLVEAKVDLRQGADSSLLGQERSINQKLSAAAAHQSSLNRNGKEQPVRSREIDDLGNQAEAISAKIRDANPRYARLTQPRPLTLTEVQKQLGKNVLLLQYTLGEQRSYLFAVTTEEMTSYELPARDIVENLARQFYDASTARNHIAPGESSEARRTQLALADAKAREAALVLSWKLLSPVANRLGSKHLVIVAPGALQLIPFASLPDPSNQQARAETRALDERDEQFNRDSDSPPLIAAHEIVVLPSMTTLSVMRQEMKNRKTPPKTVFVLGDPVFSVSDERLEGIPIRSNVLAHGQSSAMPSLPGTELIENKEMEFPRLISSRWEAKQILSLVRRGQGKLALDFRASRAMALNSELARYRFVHFATHAVIDDQHPELSGIVFSMVDEKGRMQDGFLPLNQIFNLKLPVELVVLSACRTALGKEYAGEGFVGLTRGFMYAGAQRVVVSLWQVADQPTSELMVRFYRHMLGPEKLSPAAALRAAQLELWNDPRWHSPYFWAPFILEGEWN